MSKTKLEFKESELLCYPSGIAYENDKYRVVFHEVSTYGGMITMRKHWRAYTLPSGMYVDGDKEYHSKNEAIKACQKHYEVNQ